MKTIYRIFVLSSLLVLVTIASVLVIVHLTLSGHHSLEEDILGSDFFTVVRVFEQLDLSDYYWDEFASEMSVYRYDLLVLQGDEAVFSELGRFHDQTQESLANISFEYEVVSGRIGHMTFVGRQISGYTVVALHGVETEFLEDEWVQRYFILSLVAGGLILVVALVFIKRIVWRLKRPLAELIVGVGRIKVGDFSQEIVYDSDDEFASLVQAFNQMQQHLASERTRKEADDAARKALIVGISHDLRTPLTSVKGYIKAILDGVATTASKQEKYLLIAYQKVNDIDRLLAKLIGISHLESGRLSLTIKKINLANYIREYAEKIADELVEKEVELRLDVKPGTHLVMMDIEQMNRVLDNLYDNALKYARVESLQLTLRVASTSNHVQLEFSDNGQGMPKSVVNQMFNQFWQLDISRHTTGNGLGLYIVKQLVDMHDGTITVFNKNGLQFNISFPKAGKEE